MTFKANSAEALEAFGLEEQVPSRFNPEKHNPLWGEEIKEAELFHSFMRMNPCPIPVNGKLAATVRFSVESNGDEEYARSVESSRRLHERDYERRVNFRTKASDTKEDRERILKELWQEFEPPKRDQSTKLYDGSVWNFDLSLKEANISDPVLKQFLQEGGFVCSGIVRSRTAIPTLHLGGFSDDEVELKSLCGRDSTNSVQAAYSGQPEEVGTYKVCPDCRRIAEARFKRKHTKRKPKEPEGPTPEELQQAEERWERRKKDDIEFGFQLAETTIERVNRYYKEAYKGARKDFIKELVRSNTGHEMKDIESYLEGRKCDGGE